MQDENKNGLTPETPQEPDQTAPDATGENFAPQAEDVAAEAVQPAPQTPPRPALRSELEIPQVRAREEQARKKKKEKEERRGFKYVLRDTLGVIVAAVLIAAVLKLFIVDSRLVPSGSMVPTIMNNDRVIILKFSYYFNQMPQRGDVIVFTTEAEYDGEEDLLKRVIGMPGETVEIKEGHVFIDGQAMDEPYIAEQPIYTYGPIEVPEGYYFLLGDNRNRSKDSHLWEDPFITKGDIKGKVVLCYWPLNRIGLIESIDVLEE